MSENRLLYIPASLVTCLSYWYYEMVRAVSFFISFEWLPVQISEASLVSSLEEIVVYTLMTPACHPGLGNLWLKIMFTSTRNKTVKTVRLFKAFFSGILRKVLKPVNSITY